MIDELPGTWSTRACSVVPLTAKSLAPLPGGWLALTAEGLVEIPDRGELGAPEPLAGPAPEDDDPRNPHSPALHVSADGRFVAVVIDYGRHGQLHDRRTGQLVRGLDLDHLDPDVQRFPAAFAVVAGRTVLVAGSEWNRLDVYDPATGRCLTERTTDDHEAEDYLDYFHASLVPSPFGRRLCDTGWVWHPDAMPAIVDLVAWLGGDSHAAEHPVFLATRGSKHWDQPVAWIDEDTVAVQPVDAYQLVTTGRVVIYSATTGRQIGEFAGPAGPMWGYGGLVYVQAADGLEAWDPASGKRIGVLSGFHPIGHDPNSGAFAELADGSLRVWTPMAQFGRSPDAE